jgi:hypothetical protein
LRVSLCPAEHQLDLALDEILVLFVFVHKVDVLIVNRNHLAASAAQWLLRRTFLRLSLLHDARVIRAAEHAFHARHVAFVRRDVNGPDPLPPGITERDLPNRNAT